ncbi:MAG: hypothetical protein PHC41_04895 [Lachnospiraceae bacterium]|jgi:uncharacterized membrane protein YbhN (UPF0104 family)|nr:hypothetical protein [Lachnospiraceae bacterium]MDD3615545.1 hypothetical protein [Lachnospiraceae bacterium]
MDNREDMTDEVQRSLNVYRQIQEEYEEFMMTFTKRIKVGVFAILIIPVFFLLLMFTQDSKLVFLTLWIVSILSIAAYLISQEYKKFEYESRLGLREEDEVKEKKTEEKNIDERGGEEDT